MVGWFWTVIINYQLCNLSVYYLYYVDMQQDKLIIFLLGLFILIQFHSGIIMFYLTEVFLFDFCLSCYCIGGVDVNLISIIFHNNAYKLCEREN